MSSSAKWIAYNREQQLHCPDVYCTSQYHKIFELLGDGQATVFYFEENRNFAYYPFLVNSVNKMGYQLDQEYYDIEAVYGYGGVISNCYKPAFIKNFYISFYEHCHKNNIISEFVRFNPLVANMKFSRGHMDICFDRETVVIDLQKGYENIWNAEYTQKNRHRIRKAKKMGYRYEINKNPDKTEIDKFISIYNYTMNQANAKPYYYFNEEFFINIFHYMKGSAYLFNVRNPDNEVVCSAIFLQHDNYLHYHLSGRSASADYTVNSFLLDQAIQYAIKAGLKFIHLGGGRTNKSHDSLLKFKKEFSNESRNYYIGKKIINREIYNEVVKQWCEKYPEKVNNYDDKLQKFKF